MDGAYSKQTLGVRSHLVTVTSVAIYALKKELETDTVGR